MTRLNQLDSIMKGTLVKVIAYDKFKPGVTLDTLRTYLRDGRADVNGVVIVFECASVEEAKRYVADFPLTKVGLIECDFIALDAPSHARRLHAASAAPAMRRVPSAPSSRFASQATRSSATSNIHQPLEKGLKQDAERQLLAGTRQLVFKLMNFSLAT